MLQVSGKIDSLGEAVLGKYRTAFIKKRRGKMKKKELWRFIAMMLAFILTVSVMNVPKYAGEVYAEPQAPPYSFSSDGAYLYDINTDLPVVITYTVKPQIATGHEFRLSVSTYQRPMNWEITSETTSGDSTIIEVKGTRNPDVDFYDYWEYLGATVIDSGTGEELAAQPYSFRMTDTPFVVTTNGNGGVVWDSEKQEYVSTTKEKIAKGYSLSSGVRRFSWNGSGEKLLDGYKIQGDSSGKIYTEDSERVESFPDKYALVYDYYVSSNVTADCVWSDAVTLEFKTGEGYFSKWEDAGKWNYDTERSYTVRKGEALSGASHYFVTPVTDTNKICIGWRCSANNKLYTEESLDEYVPNGDTVFTAEYMGAYTVKFVSNEGGINYASDEKEYSQLCKPNTYLSGGPYTYRQGYMLKGWNDGSKTYTNDELNNYKVTKNVTFTAQWYKSVDAVLNLHSNYPKTWGYKEKKYTLTTKADQTYSTSLSSRPYYFGNPGKYAIATYHTNSGTKYETDTQIFPPAGTTELYADWVEYNIYKINLHSNYPAGWGKEQTVTERNANSYEWFYPSRQTTTNMTKGYVEYYISYWFYYNKDGEKVPVSNRFKPTSNMDLYANWTTDTTHTHVWDGGKVIKEATYDAEGRKVFKCKNCSEEHIEAIPKKERPQSKYSEEWVGGKWYEKDGSQKYKPTGSWKGNSTGWWFEDTSGWYPSDCWQKIDGYWYYFKPDGYIACNEYYKGYWFKSDGTWDDQYYLSWKQDATGWWVEDKSGWWPSSSWLKIDGCWYYFNSSGYMVTSDYVDGYWIDADGVCR